jgi:ABC-2 type transport system permease protein/lipopolysaccharide transport system permease protein
MVDTAEVVKEAVTALRVYDAEQIPHEPPPDTLHRHRWKLGKSLKDLWASREIIVILAERDIRASYKEAFLGILWAVFTPLATLIVMVFVFKRVKAFPTNGVPYALFVYLGIITWQYFAGGFAAGANSLLGNKGLLSKVHFPRECFPLSQLVEQAFSSTLACGVLVVLCVIYNFAPHVEALWIPLFLLIELMFTAGVALGACAALVHLRDLVQLTGLVVSLGMFASPVIWPFSKIPVAFQGIYSFFNPVGPVIDNIRRTFLYGQSPDWRLLAIATAGALTYLILGFWIFRRLEADVADIA